MANLALCIIDLFIFLILIVNEISVIVIRDFCLHLLYSLNKIKFSYYSCFSKKKKKKKLAITPNLSVYVHKIPL